MKIAQWAREALRFETDNLYHFNFTNEFLRSIVEFPGSLYPELSRAHRHFAKFIMKRATGQAESDLADFKADQAFQSKFPAYAGAPASKQRTFRAIKALNGSLFLHPVKFGFSKSRVEATRKALASAVQHLIGGTGTPLHNLRADQKASLQKILDDGLKPDPRIGSLRTIASSPTIVARGRVLGAVPVARDMEPLWISTDDAIIAEGIKLPATADPLQKSGYAAGLRAALGVQSDRDYSSDGDTLSYRPRPRFKRPEGYRTIVEFKIELADTDLASVRQPNFFSNGFPHLFVSRRTPSRTTPVFDDLAGRTVRLLDLACPHSSEAACPSCGAVGLPEAVIPSEVVFGRASLTFVDAHFIFTSDLERYHPPKRETIRRKNQF